MQLDINACKHDTKTFLIIVGAELIISDRRAKHRKFRHPSCSFQQMLVQLEEVCFVGDYIQLQIRAVIVLTASVLSMASKRTTVINVTQCRQLTTESQLGT